MEEPSVDMQQDVKAELRMPYGEGGGGFLTLHLGDTRVTAEYTSAKVELLRVLNRALSDDADLPAVARGWRTPEQIAEQLSYPPTAGGIRRAVMLINRVLREAVACEAQHLNLPALIVSKRQIGLRLSWSITFLTPTEG